MEIRIYPDTPLARVAVKEGLATLDDDLLFPRFFMAKGIKGRLLETVTRWIKYREDI